MRSLLPVLFIVFVFAACADENKTHSAIAGNFIDTFYSFDADSLRSVLADAPGSHPEILFYQKWAECAHYHVVKRGEFIEKNDSTVVCPMTVRDDLMKALQIDFNVTDSFHVVIRDGRIRSVRTSSNDLDEYYKAKEWVKQSRPEYVEKACEGIWEGGPTPCECVQGMVKGFEEYVAGK
ncbi:MAG TPA: hypothetical protein VFE50_06085 [Cyclobacteriaceae bacterium]|nr:hypothetical protein [Cyclobacteriaceae bacterium]